MKLATLPDETRDGRLVVVTRDLKRCADVSRIVETLQAALDDWRWCEPALRDAAARLEDGTLPSEPFDERQALAPLPRAYQWVDGSAYVNHVELVRKARGAELPPSFWTDPLVYQGGSDDFTASHAPIVVAKEEFGIDFEAEVAVITDDVPMQCSAEEAALHIKLLLLVNDVSLRNLIPAELAKGFGFYQSKPSTSFSPVAVTPDELGPSWTGSKPRLPISVALNGELFGNAQAGEDMTFSFAELIAHVTKTRRLGAGAIVGSGTVSNRASDGGAGKPVRGGGRGYSCIAEQRMIEKIANGEPQTPFMCFGDRVRIEMFGLDGKSIFGAINQIVQAFEPSAAQSARVSTAESDDQDLQFCQAQSGTAMHPASKVFAIVPPSLD